MRHFCCCLLLALTLSPAQAETRSADLPRAIAIIGTGEVGSALGSSWGRLGHPIIYGSRAPASAKTRDLVSRSGNARAVLPAEAARHADIIVLALPFSAALELLPQLGNLDGKILIDPMNALAFDRERRRVTQSVELVAEQIQALAPGAHVVKAFNALNAGKMIPEREFAAPISVPVAGDDQDAKNLVMGLAEELGLLATDVGPLFNARYLEAMAPLYVYMNAFHRPPGGFEYNFTTSQP